MNDPGSAAAGERELDLPTFVHHARLRALEEQLYGHVLDAIDLDALHGLEQMLYSILTSRMRISSELALDLSVLMIERALVRASDDSARYLDTGPPPGITKAERDAVAFDASCPFCREAARAKRESCGASAAAIEDDEPCPCCEMLAEEWREEHREVLEAAGLRKPRDATEADAGSVKSTRSTSDPGVDVS